MVQASIISQNKYWRTLLKKICKFNVTESMKGSIRMNWVPPLVFYSYWRGGGGKFLPLRNEFNPSINSKKNFLQKLWKNFENWRNSIFLKTAQPILMAKIYVMKEPKEVMKKHKKIISWIRKGWKKLLLQLVLESREFT